MTTMKRKATHNSTFAIGGVSCSSDSLVVAESFVLRLNICAKKPARTQSRKTLVAMVGQPRNEQETSKNNQMTMVFLQNENRHQKFIS